MTLSISDVPSTAVDVGAMPSQTVPEMQIVVPQGQPISASDEDLATHDGTLERSQQEQEENQSASVIAAALMSLHAAQALAVVTLGAEPADKKKRPSTATEK